MLLRHAQLPSTSDINNNNNFDGPETVDLSSGVHAFEISGPCTWNLTK